MGVIPDRFDGRWVTGEGLLVRVPPGPEEDAWMTWSPCPIRSVAPPVRMMHDRDVAGMVRSDSPAAVPDLVRHPKITTRLNDQLPGNVCGDPPSRSRPIRFR